MVTESNAAMTVHQARVEEELIEMKKRFQLLEGDGKAYYEASQFTIRQNKESIMGMRAENKSLRAALAHITQLENAAAKMKLKGQEQPLDEKVLSLRNKASAMAHTVRTKEDQMRKLQDDLADLEQEAKNIKANEEESPHAKQLRMLENRLDKAVIKFDEAQSIRKTYEQIVKRLEKERLGFDNQIAQLERAIKQKRKEFAALESMANDAVHARDTAKEEFLAFEQWLNDERRAREKTLSERRELVAQKIELNEKMEKRQQRLQVTSHEQQQQQAKPAVATTESESKQEEKITNYEEALRRIKDATGVSELSEVVEKFMTQGDTHKHLMELKGESDAKIQELMDEKRRLREQFEEMKYSGDSKYSGGRRLIDEFEGHLAEAKERHGVSKERFDRTQKVMMEVKAGIEHLSDKLEFLSAPKSLAVSAGDADNYVVELLAQCEHKLSTLTDGMVDKEEAAAAAGGAAGAAGAEGGAAPAPPSIPVLNLLSELPKHNVRIKLSSRTDDLLSEDEDEDDNDDSLLNREAMKKDSFKLLESKTKKKQKRMKKKRA